MTAIISKLEGAYYRYRVVGYLSHVTVERRFRSERKAIAFWGRLAGLTQDVDSIQAYEEARREPKGDTREADPSEARQTSASGTPAEVSDPFGTNWPDPRPWE